MKRFLNPITLGLLAVMLFFTVSSGSMSNPAVFIMQKALILPGIIIGLAFHEFAHGYMSNKLGDPTPKYQGRLTLNPVAHMDPLGFIALLFVGFGWGKPVEVNPTYYKDRRKGEILVSLAGVFMNLVLAVVFTFVYKILSDTTGMSLYSDGMGKYIMLIVFYTVYINIVLMIFNLLPVPPLDGFNLFSEVFNLKGKDIYYKLYNNGFIILMVLILFNFTGRILTPMVNVCMSLLSNITPFV